MVPSGSAVRQDYFTRAAKMCMVYKMTPICP